MGSDAQPASREGLRKSAQPLTSTLGDAITPFLSQQGEEFTMFIKAALATLVTALALSFSVPVHAEKQMGDRCIRDGECASGECKKFQCTIRLKPKGQIGDRCVVDGDCASDECKKLRCVQNEYKQGK